MATRLKTRLSAGAALVTGLGMMGVATALPAQAATTLTYSCTVDVGTTPLGAGTATVTFDTNAPATAAPGDTLTVDSVTADVTIPVAGMTADADTEGSGLTFPVAAEVRAGGTVIGSVDATLTSTSITAGEGELQAQLSDTQSRSIVVPDEAAGTTFEVIAPTSLEGTLTFPEGSEVPEATVRCETDSADRVIDTVTVTAPTTGEDGPVDGGDDVGEDATTDDQGEGTAPVGDDTVAVQPEVPEVVQTDGLTPQMLPREDDTAALALGGLLLAGVGAGTVLVARRRAQQH